MNCHKLLVPSQLASLGLLSAVPFNPDIKTQKHNTLERSIGTQGQSVIAAIEGLRQKDKGTHQWSTKTTNNRITETLATREGTRQTGTEGNATQT